jgi:uncharacterized protein
MRQIYRISFVFETKLMKHLFKKQHFLLILIVILGVISGFAQNKKPKRTTNKKYVSQAESNSLLYKINGKNLAKPSYIYGTVHIICPTDMFAMDKLSSYFDQTDGLILELDMDDTEVMKKMTTALNMPEGKNLKDLLTPEKYAKVDEMYKNIYGVPVEAFKAFNPMGLSIIISTSPKSIGCPVPASYEAKFLEMATKAKKDVVGLESVEVQMATLAKTPIEKQAEDLYKLSTNPQKGFDGFKELILSYKLQDSEKLFETMTKLSDEDPEAMTNLLDERNANWIPKIETAITEKSRFIAVGGGHLGGKNGVVKLLRKQGYTVTAIKF